MSICSSVSTPVIHTGLPANPPQSTTPVQTVQHQSQSALPELAPSPVIQQIQTTNTSVPVQIQVPAQSGQSIIPNNTLLQSLSCANPTIHAITPSTYTMHTVPINNPVVPLHSLQNSTQVVHSLPVTGGSTSLHTLGDTHTTTHLLPPGAIPSETLTTSALLPGTNPSALFPVPTVESANMAVQELQEMITMIQHGNYRPGLLNNIHSLAGSGRV